MRVTIVLVAERWVRVRSCGPFSDYRGTVGRFTAGVAVSQVKIYLPATTFGIGILVCDLKFPASVKTL